MAVLDAVPSLFRELYDAGRFDYWGTTEPLTSEQRAALLTQRRTEVLWWDGIEWDRTPDDVASYDGDGMLRPGLVPFAGNGAGDHYCWYVPWQTGPEPPVVLAVHDQVTSEVFAADLAGCLVRCLVQHFAWHEFEPGEPDAATLWAAHRRTLDPHLDPAQRAFLDDLGPDPAAERCEEADARLGAGTGGRDLIATLQPTRYVLDWLTEDDARRCYDRSVAFYEALVAEGHPEFATELEETRRNRDLRGRGA